MQWWWCWGEGSRRWRTMNRWCSENPPKWVSGCTLEKGQDNATLTEGEVEEQRGTAIILVTMTINHPRRHRHCHHHSKCQNNVENIATVQKRESLHAWSGSFWRALTAGQQKWENSRFESLWRWLLTWTEHGDSKHHQIESSWKANSPTSWKFHWDLGVLTLTTLPSCFTRTLTVKERKL